MKEGYGNERMKEMKGKIRTEGELQERRRGKLKSPVKSRNQRKKHLRPTRQALCFYFFCLCFSSEVSVASSLHTRLAHMYSNRRKRENLPWGINEGERCLDEVNHIKPLLFEFIKVSVCLSQRI